eukprot:7388160-Prymnesium_polylepis.1
MPAASKPLNIRSPPVHAVATRQLCSPRSAGDRARMAAYSSRVQRADTPWQITRCAAAGLSSLWMTSHRGSCMGMSNAARYARVEAY